jgi:beta-glucosidase/6-phospho-beta-glucosidase/beta-galactosidase
MLPLANQWRVVTPAPFHTVQNTTSVSSLPSVRFGIDRPVDQFKSQVYPLDRQLKGVLKWAKDFAKTLQPTEHPHVFTEKTEPAEKAWRFYIPSAAKVPMNQVPRIQIAEIPKTLNLYKRTFQKFFWTGIECSNPLSDKGERWDELAYTNFYDTANRRRQIALMKAYGIENVRLGIPNHKIAESKGWQTFDKVRAFCDRLEIKPLTRLLDHLDKALFWQPFTEIIKDFKREGIKISLDLQHFGLPQQFHNKENPAQSDYLNPEWVDHYTRFALTTVKHYSSDLDAITLINEPLVTNKFSGLWWNESFPGNETDPRFNRFFIERGLLIGKAAIKARIAIEQYLKETETNPERARKIYVHNESLERRSGEKSDTDFNEFKRFLTSDLILGQDWLLKSDKIKPNPMMDWIEAQYIRPDHKTEDQQKLYASLEEVRSLHQELQKTTGKTMTTDTVFGIDYYVPCEDGLDKNPREYAKEAILPDMRQGLYRMGLTYWNRYHLPLLHTETNMANAESSGWAKQQLLEMAQLAKSGIPVLGFNWYSLLDQFGWENGMQGSPNNAMDRVWPVGMFNATELAPGAFATEVYTPLRRYMEQSPR